MINNRIAELYSEYSDRPRFWPLIAEKINKEFGTTYTPDGVRTKYKRYKKLLPRKNPQFTDTGKPQNTLTIDRTYDNKGNLNIASTSTRIKTIEQLIAAADVDLRTWQIERPEVRSWESLAKVDGDVVIETLYRVKIGLIRNKEELDRGLLDDLREDLRQHSPRVVYQPRVRDDNGCMLELSIPDLHFGKLTYQEESGYDYNMGTAKQLFLNAIMDLVSQAKGRNVDTVLFPLGNDLFNADMPGGFTTNGTKQDMDGMYRRHFREVRTMVSEAIEYLKAEMKAKIVVKIVPGNHDRFTMFTLGCALEDRYYNDEMVEIDNSDSLRKYYSYGSVLVGFTHGSDEKVNALPMIMATEQAAAWSLSRFREWHIGHTHAKKEIQYLPVFEENGVRVRVIPSLCAADNWHYQKGYVQNLRGAEAYLYDKTRGMISIFMSNLS